MFARTWEAEKDGLVASASMIMSTHVLWVRSSILLLVGGGFLDTILRMDGALAPR
jgi:hypothetical protein